MQGTRGLEIAGNELAKRYLTLKETAAYLGMSPTTLYRLTYRMTDRLPFYKVGKLKLFRVEDVDQWMDRHRIEDRPMAWGRPATV